MTQDADSTFVVVCREGAWWVLFDHARAGPYVTEQLAQESAVRRARISGANGKESRVWVDEPDDGMPEIYHHPGAPLPR